MVMIKATNMVDRKISELISEQEKARNLHELNFKTKMSELKRDMQQMS